MKLTLQTLRNNGNVEFESIKPKSGMDCWDIYDNLKQKYSGEGYEKHLDLDNLDIKIFMAVELATNDVYVVNLVMR